MRRSQSIAGVFFALAILCAMGGSVQAQDTANRQLIVGTKHAPPFAIKNPDGTWEGISISLWQTIATEMGLTYELREFDLKGLLQGVAQGTLDAGVAALTITADREKRLDFTHAFYTTGLGIAVRPHGKRHWWGAVRQMFSWQFLEVISMLGLILFIVGVLIWLIERRRNIAQFGGGVAHGLGSGFWWAAVTMTTVGYGDKAPVTLGGRCIALIWMFAGIIMISGFTAAITTALTVSQLGDVIRGPSDLLHVRVGTMPGTSSEDYLQQQRLTYRTYHDPQTGMQALDNNEIDALVYDAPLLHYLAMTTFKGAVEVLPNTFERQDYGIALQEGSALREPINRTLLEVIYRKEWQDVLYHYLGQ